MWIKMKEIVEGFKGRAKMRVYWLRIDFYLENNRLCLRGLDWISIIIS